jgi:four helix bundle protein
MLEAARHEIAPKRRVLRCGIEFGCQCRMNSADYRARTRAFAIQVVREVRRLPPTLVCRVIGAQLIRSATSTASNYRASCRGRSRAEFVAKLGTVLEEVDESALWLDLLVESGERVPLDDLRRLKDEAEELAARTAASIATAARKLPASHPARRLSERVEP